MIVNKTPIFEYVEEIILKLDLPNIPFSDGGIDSLSLVILLELKSLKAINGPKNGALLKKV